MTKRYYVRLYEKEKDALVKLAIANRRHPCDEAAVMVVEALRAKGLLPAADKPQERPNA